MSNEGTPRVANLVWDNTLKTWVREPNPEDVMHTINISGITPIGGKLPVDTEITVEGNVIVENVKIQSAPLTEVFASGTFPVTDNGESLTVDGTVSISHPVVISGTQTVTATDLDIRDLDYNQDNVSVNVGHPIIVSGIQTTVNVSGTEISDWVRINNADDLVTVIQYNEPTSRDTVSGINYTSAGIGLSALETFASGVNTITITRS